MKILDANRCSFRPTALRAALGCALVFTSIATAETVDTISKNFSVTPGGQLVVAIDNGAINVRTADVPQVTVEVVRKVRAPTKEKEEEILGSYEVTIEQSGNTVTVREQRKTGVRSWWSSMGSENTDFRFNITVPTRFDTDLKTSGGGIDVNGLSGKVLANTSGGGLRFIGINGPIDGRTSGGGITLAECKGEVKVRSSGGGIESNDGAGPLDLDTSGGGITVRSHRGDVVAHTSGGGITTENIVGSVNGSTSGGSIRAILAAQPSGDCRLSTSGGGITVKLPAGAALEVDASTSAGNVSSDFAVSGSNSKRSSSLRGKINGGGSLLHLRSSAGNIHLEKLAGGPEA